MSKWISVEDELPEEPKKYEQTWVDVWSKDERITDVNFFNGKFWIYHEDCDGDFSHHEEIENVTHWMIEPKPPKQ